MRVIPTPTRNGRYQVIPYSNKINWALDRTTADLIVYVDNGSLPHPAKIELMAGALEARSDWGAVYCGQERTGWNPEVHRAIDTIANGSGQVNYTQVMHRRTNDRWPTDMRLADPDVADGHFWAKLAVSLGPLHPVAPNLILDEHHMPSHKAAGV